MKLVQNLNGKKYLAFYETIGILTKHGNIHCATYKRGSPVPLFLWNEFFGSKLWAHIFTDKQLVSNTHTLFWKWPLFTLCVLSMVTLAHRCIVHLFHDLKTEIISPIGFLNFRWNLFCVCVGGHPERSPFREYTRRGTLATKSQGIYKIT